MMMMMIIIHFNSLFLCAASAAKRKITDTAHMTMMTIIIIIIIIIIRRFIIYVNIQLPGFCSLWMADHTFAALPQDKNFRYSLDRRALRNFAAGLDRVLAEERLHLSCPGMEAPPLRP
jgi:hypothetical protein